MVTGYIKLANGHEKLVIGHEKLVIGHDEKLNFFKTGHQTDWSDWSWADYDQTGHKRLNTRNVNYFVP
jgi:hypothetical protein